LETRELDILNEARCNVARCDVAREAEKKASVNRKKTKAAVSVSNHALITKMETGDPSPIAKR
jgi:hypothetical protein